MPHEKKPRKPRPPRAPKDPSLRHKMYQYRLYPTRKQVGTLEWILRRSKELYNAALEIAAWGTLIRLCASKAEEAGCTVVKVSPRTTTQACSDCGSLVPKDLTVRWHSCPACGCELDRDENAARNILSRYKHLETPLVVFKEKKPRLPKKNPGAGSVPQSPCEEPASPGDCRSHRL